MPKGAVLIFDELNCPPFPGETVALEEVLGIAKTCIAEVAVSTLFTYAVIGE